MEVCEDGGLQVCDLCLDPVFEVVDVEALVEGFVE